MTLLYQNNLNLTDDVNHVSAILLDPMTPSEAAPACAALSEQLLPSSTLQQHSQDFFQQLNYLTYSGRYSQYQNYLVDGGAVALSSSGRTVKFSAAPPPSELLPVLCTQSSTANRPGTAVANSSTEISIVSNSNTYVGFRNQKAWRFIGIPYAETPERFTYSTISTARDQTIQATTYGSQCLQASVTPGGSEDCLFLNIQTPFIPRAGSRSDLKPVLFWIHGGGFTGGSGSAPDTDGSQWASREDIVVVTINYRLSTLGFLAVPNTALNGNYGIGDQTVALQVSIQSPDSPHAHPLKWTIENIAQFGGDPDRITLIGDSAGAGSVRVLLGSPKAIGKFQGAIAMSNLGGGVDLGLTGNYGTPYSSYYTIEQSYALAKNVISEVGCNTAALDEQVACLQAVNATTLQSTAPLARYVVQDGTYVDTPELVLTGPNPKTARVDVVFGGAANDGASFSTFPTAPIANESQGIQEALGISAAFAEDIINSGLFPYYDTGHPASDSFNVSQRVVTDNMFRCVDQATVYAGGHTGAFRSAYYYRNDRTLGGYNPNNLPGPANGDPNQPYYRLHGGDVAAYFGWQTPYRDAADLYYQQVVLGYYGAFIRTGVPVPPASLLAVRGYSTVAQALQESGPWQKITSQDGPVHLFDFPGSNTNFIDTEQCAFLNYSITYYTGSTH